MVGWQEIPRCHAWYREEPASLPWQILMDRGSWSCHPRQMRAQALAKLEEAIGKSEHAITRQLITIAALERRGQDARNVHELLRVAEDHLTAAHTTRERLLAGSATRQHRAIYLPAGRLIQVSDEQVCSRLSIAAAQHGGALGRHAVDGSAPWRAVDPGAALRDLAQTLASLIDWPGLVPGLFFLRRGHGEVQQKLTHSYRDKQR